VTDQIHSPAVASPQSEHRYPLASKLGQIYSCSGHCVGQKYFLLLPGIESRLLDCPVHSLLNIHRGYEIYARGKQILWVSLLCAEMLLVSKCLISMPFHAIPVWIIHLSTLADFSHRFILWLRVPWLPHPLFVYRRRETMSDFFKQTNNLLRDFFLTRKHRLPIQSPWIIRSHFLIRCNNLLQSMT
jgi:hypothetical protein